VVTTGRRGRAGDVYRLSSGPEMMASGVVLT
jgi:hypothetical protein